jgi:hypothetical protein
MKGISEDDIEVLKLLENESQFEPCPYCECDPCDCDWGEE